MLLGKRYPLWLPPQAALGTSAHLSSSVLASRGHPGAWHSGAWHSGAWHSGARHSGARGIQGARHSGCPAPFANSAPYHSANQCLAFRCEFTIRQFARTDLYCQCPADRFGGAGQPPGGGDGVPSGAPQGSEAKAARNEADSLIVVPHCAPDKVTYFAEAAGAVLAYRKHNRRGVDQAGATSCQTEKWIQTDESNCLWVVVMRIIVVSRYARLCRCEAG